VAPSLGSTVLTVPGWAASMVLAMTCQVVPSTRLPFSKASAALRESAEYSPPLTERFTRSTAITEPNRLSTPINWTLSVVSSVNYRPFT
jgi:hypothetical protein